MMLGEMVCSNPSELTSGLYMAQLSNIDLYELVFVLLDFVICLIQFFLAILPFFPFEKRMEGLPYATIYNMHVT